MDTQNGCNGSVNDSGSGDFIESEHKVWKLVLTGGPCGGKTTAQV